MRSPDSETGAELPATLWEALLYDAVDPLQTLQVHEPVDSVSTIFSGKSARADVTAFRSELAKQLKVKARDKRVFRGTANAFLIFGSPTGPSSWMFRFRDREFEIDVRNVRITVAQG